MHILVASWNVLDFISLWPYSIVFQIARLFLSTFYVSILTNYVMKEPDDERGKYVRTHAFTKTVVLVQLHRTETPIVWSHPPMVRMRKI